MKLKALLLCSLLTLALSAVAFGQGSTSPSSQDPSMQSPSTQAPSTTSPSTEASPTSSSSAASAASENTFTGSIAKSGGKYVLHAAEGDYKLDDQGQAQSFEGKDVKVTGTLDSKGRTIKVKSIEPASK